MCGRSSRGSGRGRLIFAMDATMSRQPSWDLALELQADMFKAVKAVGGLDVQLVYFRGFNECQASKWVGDPDALARLMRQVSCAGGFTQISKVLSHARRESETAKVNALVYVGDCMEEDVDRLGQARRRARHDRRCRCSCSRRAATRRPSAPSGRSRGSRAGPIARSTPARRRQLRELLTAVAVYATGGRKALQDFSEETKSGASLAPPRAARLTA